MAFDVTFHLTDEDLTYFRDSMQKTLSKTRNLSEQSILDNAQTLAQQAQHNAPEFVTTRIEKLKTMIAMVQDADWQMPDEERQDVLAALAYFSHEQDLVPDHIPVLGFLDDAIMIELVAEALTDDVEAYQDFCSYREREQGRSEQGVTTEDWLADKRRELHDRMRTRRKSRRGGSSRVAAIF